MEFHIEKHSPEEALQLLKELAMQAPGGTLNESLAVIQAVEAAAATLTRAIESKPLKKE